MEAAAVAWAREVLTPDRVTWIRTRPWAEVWQLDTADDRSLAQDQLPADGLRAAAARAAAAHRCRSAAAVHRHDSRPWALIRDAGRPAREAHADVEPAIDWGDAVIAHPFGTLLVTWGCWPPSSRWIATTRSCAG